MEHTVERTGEIARWDSVHALDPRRALRSQRVCAFFGPDGEGSGEELATFFHKLWDEKPSHGPSRQRGRPRSLNSARPVALAPTMRLFSYDWPSY